MLQGNAVLLLLLLLTVQKTKMERNIPTDLLPTMAILRCFC